ncbi:hypothetical protein OH76DRAFT_203552 [Lentinus brumalis]|uniref:Uncharacterized protein n=1 Tax=Lentinus brumalis TaxID=2498619 RepID=A0A371DIB9_9APHY|nr:hypothetical protein OH76DRAFT_203552 [Polyporus brumalis]
MEGLGLGCLGRYRCDDHGPQGYAPSLALDSSLRIDVQQQCDARTDEHSCLCTLGSERTTVLHQRRTSDLWRVARHGTALGKPCGSQSYRCSFGATGRPCLTPNVSLMYLVKYAAYSC